MSETSPSAKLVKTKAKPKITKNEEQGQPVAQAEPQTATVEATKEPKLEKVDSGSPDLIVQVAHEVENLNEKKAFNLVPSLLDNIERDYFKLGGVISVIQAQGWFMDKGYENFKAFVNAELGIKYRKALYLIDIYNGLVSSGVQWSDVKHLGWTKLKELAGILTPENVSEWVSHAENMTVLQLQDYIRQQEAAVSLKATGTDEQEAKQTTTMTFKLHADQKETVREALDKCKAQMNTEYDAVALEHIALDYLGGDKKIKKMPTLVELMKSKSVEEMLEAFTSAYPDLEISAVVPE